MIRVVAAILVMIVLVGPTPEADGTPRAGLLDLVPG